MTTASATVFAALLLSAAASIRATPARAQDLPVLAAGEGRDALLLMCDDCHSATVVANHKRMPAEWQKVIGQMRDKGAAGDDDDAAKVLAYLLRNYGIVDVNAADQKNIVAVLGVSADVADKLIAARPLATLEAVQKNLGMDDAAFALLKDRVVIAKTEAAAPRLR